MPISVKVAAGNKVKEPGYYAATYLDNKLIHGKTDDDSSKLEIYLTVDYDGQVVDVKDVTYTTISENSKLAQLCVALGMYPSVADCVESCEQTGEIPDLLEGPTPVRVHFDRKISADKRSYIALVGYEPPKQPKRRPQFPPRAADPDDIPF